MPPLCPRSGSSSHWSSRRDGWRAPSRTSTPCTLNTGPGASTMLSQVTIVVVHRLIDASPSAHPCPAFQPFSATGFAMPGVALHTLVVPTCRRSPTMSSKTLCLHTSGPASGSVTRPRPKLRGAPAAACRSTVLLDVAAPSAEVPDVLQLQTLPSIFSALTVSILRWRSHSPRSRSRRDSLRSEVTLDRAMNTHRDSALEDLVDLVLEDVHSSQRNDQALPLVGPSR